MTQKTTYIICCPHLSYGGSEKHVMEFVKAAQGRADIEIWVDSDNIAWGAGYLNSFGCKAQIFHSTTNSAQAFLDKSMHRLAGCNLIFHIVNSAFGFALLPAIAHLDQARFFISAFSDLVLPDGRKIAGIRFLQPEYCSLAKGVFVDSAHYRDTLANDGIMAPDRIFIVAHPPAIQTQWEKPTVSGHLLWASRVSDEKRLEDVIGIALAFPNLRVSVYGGVDNRCCSQRGLSFYEALSFLPNVEVMGEYRKFDDIPISNYDALIYTSEMDGLPNVLIEAGAAGMPVISTLVGGIGELLDDTNSFCKQKATLLDYIVLISDLYTNYDIAIEKGRRLKNTILNRSLNHPLSDALDLILDLSDEPSNR